MAYNPSLIADMHTHVLPEVDHGSQSLKESLNMLTDIYESGIRYVAATHHYNALAESPSEYLKRRNTAYEKLCEFASEKTIPEIVLGAELSYFSGIGSMFDLSPLAVGSSKYILIEPPYKVWEDKFFKDMEDVIFQQNLIPIVAHLERYEELAPKKYQETLRDIGCVLQYNAVYLLQSPKKAAKRIPKDARIVFGSDAHNTSDRAPNLENALSVCKEVLPPQFYESAEEITREVFKI